GVDALDDRRRHRRRARIDPRATRRLPAGICLRPAGRHGHSRLRIQRGRGPRLRDLPRPEGGAARADRRAALRVSARATHVVPPPASTDMSADPNSVSLEYEYHVAAQELGRRVLLAPELAIAGLVAPADAVRARRLDDDDVRGLRRRGSTGSRSTPRRFRPCRKGRTDRGEPEAPREVNGQRAAVARAARSFGPLVSSLQTPPHAAYSHSSSVGKRLSAHRQYAHCVLSQNNTRAARGTRAPAFGKNSEATKQAPATTTTSGPASRRTSDAASAPPVVDTVETIAAMTSIPVKLRATRFAVTAGMMMSEPMRRAPEERRPRAIVSAKRTRNRRLSRATSTPAARAISGETSARTRRSLSRRTSPATAADPKIPTAVSRKVAGPDPPKSASISSSPGVIIPPMARATEKTTPTTVSVAMPVLVSRRQTRRAPSSRAVAAPRMG